MQVWTDQPWLVQQPVVTPWREEDGRRPQQQCLSEMWMVCQLHPTRAKWDGEFQETGKTLIQHPPVTSLSLHQLRAALKSRGVSAAGNKPTLMERLQALYDMEQSK